MKPAIVTEIRELLADLRAEARFAEGHLHEPDALQAIRLAEALEHQIATLVDRAQRPARAA